VLLAGDRAAGAIEVPPLRMAALREANQTSLERFTTGVRTLFFRYLRLGILLTDRLRDHRRRLHRAGVRSVDLGDASTAR
jgi:hypothetical protein